MIVGVKEMDTDPPNRFILLVERVNKDESEPLRVRRMESVRSRPVTDSIFCFVLLNSISPKFRI